MAKQSQLSLTCMKVHHLRRKQTVLMAIESRPTSFEYPNPEILMVGRKVLSVSSILSARKFRCTMPRL